MSCETVLSHDTNGKTMKRKVLLSCLVSSFLGGCLENEPVEFENIEHDVYVRDVTQTMQRMAISSIEDMSCDELCYTVDGMNTREYNITECSTDIDTVIFEGELSDLDGSILAGSVTCSGSVLFYEK